MHSYGGRTSRGGACCWSESVELGRERQQCQAPLDVTPVRATNMDPPGVISARPAQALLKEGRSLKETARILGVSRNTLRRRLRESGVWPEAGLTAG